MTSNITPDSRYINVVVHRYHTDTHTTSDVMAQIHVANRQNPLLFQIDMENDVDIFRQRCCTQLRRTYLATSDDYDGMLDEAFRVQCRRIATGYAWMRNLMAETGRATFKTAVRRDREFQAHRPRRKKQVYREIKHITSIVENWQSIKHNCSLPWMINIDVRTYPLWKLSKCKNYNYVEKENKKDDVRTRTHVIPKEYNVQQVQDVVENKDGATEAILEQVDNDADQIDLICEDIKIAFHRRARGLF